MLQKFYTTKLFYNKYLYKLRVKSNLAPLFRGLNLGYVKTKLDVMQRDAEADLPITSPFNFSMARRKEKTISLETFMDACVVYNALEKNKSNTMVRCEGFNLDIYSNEPDWLQGLMTQIDVLQWHEPENDEIFDYLIDNANTKIVDGKVEWEFKAFLGRNVDPNFAEYCENNPDGFRIGKVAKRVVKNNHFAEGFYFFAKNERYLMLAKIALGGQIRRVIKYVSQQDLHK
mgnify:FL=1|tara:strand:+ start:1439 stop:2128 length:690 start_codon:yes stop_codon:yes gene_type:complete